MYALSNDVKMAVVAYKMAAAAILVFRKNAVTFEPFNRFSPNLKLGVQKRIRNRWLAPKLISDQKQDGGSRHLGF